MRAATILRYAGLPLAFLLAFIHDLIGMALRKTGYW